MYFDSWSGFLAMGGHGFYVWSAYAFALAVLAYNLISPFMAKRRVIEKVRRQERLMHRKVVVDDFRVTTGSSDNSGNRSANPTLQKHRPERQEAGPESAKRSPQ